eukprot:GFUD01023504.1.p1 GENE.GFUD01023504.1~~GFUD01023504.1.p1  ORF type:complete len:459 (-),score=150.33 GFUD01023504.1:116-1492(-)
MAPTGQADFNRVPVVNVHKENLAQHQPGLVQDIQACDFLAIDCELSGLGDRKKLNAPTIDDRYKNTCLVAKTRSVISLGLSLFRLLPNPPDSSVSHWTYSVKTYNLLVLCSEDYIVEPASLQFLVQHGFDFCSQYRLGIGYNRGNDTSENETVGKQPLREIFTEIVGAKKPLVLHNGLIDLIFLYHNLWAALPAQLGTFISDITEMFPAGIYDTKYIADYVSRTQASFLEFVFRKEQKTNAEKFAKCRPHVKLIFDQEDMDCVEWRLCGLNSDPEAASEPNPEVCFSYAHHGHCPAGTSCKLSHNIDSIIKQTNEEQDKKRRKRKNEDTENTGNGSEEKLAKTDNKAIKDSKDDESDTAGVDTKSAARNSGGHRAGYDAFMTAFSFSTFLVHQTQLPAVPDSFLPAGIKADRLANKIYLVCKDFPLLVQKSAFSKCSVQHDSKMRRLGLYDNDDNQGM